MAPNVGSLLLVLFVKVLQHLEYKVFASSVLGFVCCVFNLVQESVLVALRVALLVVCGSQGLSKKVELHQKSCH